MPAGDSGFPGGTSVEVAAFRQETWARRTMYGAVNSASSQKTRVGGVDDGIDMKCRDVPQNGL